MAQQFLTDTLRPWLDKWQWAYTRVLLAPEERDGHFIEFVTDDLLSVDHKTRADAYLSYRSMGAMTASRPGVASSRRASLVQMSTTRPYSGCCRSTISISSQCCGVSFHGSAM